MIILLALASLAYSSIVLPKNLNVNSELFLNISSLNGSYSIRRDGALSCTLASTIAPCNCLRTPGTYQLYNGSTEVDTFVVGPPKIRIDLPKKHEILNELRVFIQPKLCEEETYTVVLRYRTHDVMPDVTEPWNTVSTTSILLHRAKTAVLFPCDRFDRIGFYSVQLVSSHNVTVEAPHLLSVNFSSATALSLRSDSIFPHCSAEMNIAWTTPKCLSAAWISYRIRILAVPEGEKEERALYVEEMPVAAPGGQTAISCAQFDIIYERYCFELVSVSRNSSHFHLWHSQCVSTEPVIRKDGGWSEWGKWGECSASCGQGVEKRERYCDQPAPMRGRQCIGAVAQTRTCKKSDCPVTLPFSPASQNCSCGCELTEEAGTFFATPHDCAGNLTWTLPVLSYGEHADFVIRPTGDAGERMFIYRDEKLFWHSGDSSDQVSVPLDTRTRLVMTHAGQQRGAAPVPAPAPAGGPGHYEVSDPSGFLVVYVMRAPPSHLSAHGSPSCHPMCAETAIIGGMGILFLLIIFVPPIMCSTITRHRGRKRASDLPVSEKRVDNDMIRSSNTECTQVSQTRPLLAKSVAKRSIGIQLSCTSTPRVARTCRSVDSPMPRGMSSLSQSDELEYDYYDGTQIPGSLLGPLLPPALCTEIDIDQIIAQSRLVIDSIETNDADAQIDM